MVEISKYMSTYFLQGDAFMMVPSRFRKGEILALKANTYNLHESLGEISYVFCDKTGTLTQNELKFSHMSVCAEGD